jgi:hypothetical protein
MFVFLEKNFAKTNQKDQKEEQAKKTNLVSKLICLNLCCQHFSKDWPSWLGDISIMCELVLVERIVGKIFHLVRKALNLA